MALNRSGRSCVIIIWCVLVITMPSVQSHHQIQAIDMGREGLHNEGAELLKQRLNNHVKVDGPTSRRLFTLIVS